MQVFLLLFMAVLGLTLWGRARFVKVYQQEVTNFLPRRIEGATLARMILEKQGIEDVSVEKRRTLLDDFYSPEQKKITLSPLHFEGTNFSSLAIAALQAGKAIQHHEGHRPLLWRAGAIRSTTYLSLPLALLAAIALILGMGKTLFPVFVLLWTLVALWNLMTIPTEVDAGERVKPVLTELGVFQNLDQRVGVERVIGAASTAYIDGVFTVGSWAARTLLPRWRGSTRG